MSLLFNKTGVCEGFGAEDTLSPEAQSMIMEAVLLDAPEEELQAFLEDASQVNKAIGEELVLEKTIVRLDKKAKISKAQKMAVFTIAKEKNDRHFKKLLTIWKMERFLESLLFKKYGNEALRRAKKAVGNGSKSNVAVVKKAAAKAKAQFNGGK